MTNTAPGDFSYDQQDLLGRRRTRDCIKYNARTHLGPLRQVEELFSSGSTSSVALFHGVGGSNGLRMDICLQRLLLFAPSSALDTAGRCIAVLTEKR